MERLAAFILLLGVFVVILVDSTLRRGRPSEIWAGGMTLCVLAVVILAREYFGLKILHPVVTALAYTALGICAFGLYRVLARQKPGIVARIETPTELTWPKRCTGCGQDLRENTAYEVEVKPMKALFARGTPDTVAFTVCQKCSRKISSSKRLESIGWKLASFTLLLAIIVGVSKSLPPESMYGAGGLFWLGALLGFVGGRRRKNAVGIQCIRFSENKWVFRFRNCAFRKEFEEANSQVLKE